MAGEAGHASDVVNLAQEPKEQSSRQREPEEVDQFLIRAPQRFEFFQAVRLLKLLAIRSPEYQGQMRFGTHLSLDFPASDIQSLTRTDSKGIKMRVNFMGLTGPSGVMPRFYTEDLVNQRFKSHYPNREVPCHEFFELFDHRLIELFFGAWEKYRYPIRFERGDLNGSLRYLMSIAGLGTPKLFGRQASGLDDARLAQCSGLISRRPLSAASLTLTLQHVFNVRVQVEQFRGQWIALHSDLRCRLGTAKFGEGGGFIGRRSWSHLTNIRLHIGPLSMRSYKSFLPHQNQAESSKFLELKRLIRFLLGRALTIDVRLILMARQAIEETSLAGDQQEIVAPQIVLGKSGGAQLGWTTWLCNRTFDDHAPGAILAID